MPHLPEPFDRTPLASDLRQSILRNESEKEASAEGVVMDEINLDDFLRANESRDPLASRVACATASHPGDRSESLGKVTLTFQGSTLDDFAVHVEGPGDLKAKIEEALRNP